jgi:tetratricopeptide (TPR) repeat protein
VAGTLHNLAALYVDIGDPDKYILAEQYIQRALTIWEQTYGTSMHPDVAASTRILGRLYSRQRLYDDAKSNYDRALAIYEQLPESKHLAIAQLQRDLEELRRDRELDEQAQKAPADE